MLGSSGFIGQHLVNHLRDLGVETVSVPSSRIDLCKPSSIDSLISAVKKGDALIFASCITREKGEDIPTFMNNLLMAQHVGAFLEQSGCNHVIYISSDSVYADTANPVREDSESNPSGLYGMSHLVREWMVGYSAQKANIPMLVLRLCAVYGAGDTHNGYGPNRFLRTALREGKITLFGEGEEKRDHIYVCDVCRLIELCLLHRSTGVVNLATGIARSFAEVARAVISVSGKPVQIQSIPRKAAITHRQFDVAAIFKGFPSFSFTPFEKALQMTIQKSSSVPHA